jgi:hypothetical protein
MISPLHSSRSSGWRTAACAAGLFVLNAWICHDLFHAEFTKQLGSIEAAFISFARWLADHWDDRRWFPLWVGGMPVRQVYNPLLHHSVALLSLLTGWTPQHAYHFVTAATYSLGPVTLFWLCYRLSRRRGFALLTGVIYSLLSPSLFLIAAFHQDAGGYAHPRRYQTLVEYGEGPHVTALMWIPLAIWLIEEAAARRRWYFLPLAPVVTAALVLTNWTGTTGFLMALAAYVLAKLAARTEDTRPLHWPTFAGIGVVAYMLAAPWIPPSLIRSVQEASAKLEIVSSPWIQLSGWGALAGVLAAVHFLLHRLRMPAWQRFFVYYSIVSGAIVLGRMWFGWVLVPIASRFHLELEMALAGVAAVVCTALLARAPRPAQWAIVALIVVSCGVQTLTYRRYAAELAEPIDFLATTEFRMGLAFDANFPGQRVFAPGSVSYWLNLYSDLPQVFGCCDQSMRSEPQRVAPFFIYSGLNGGARDGEISVLWLKAFGASAVGVAQTATPQIPQPYGNVRKFDGLLPEAWRDGEDVIYRVPRATTSLAYVLRRSDLMTRAPENGIDIEPLEPFIAALDHPPGAASFRWLSQHEAEITAHTEPGQIVYLQQTCDPGWHAFEGPTELRLSCDPLGMTVIEPPAPGNHTIRMTYSGSLEDRLAGYAQLTGLATLVAWTLLAKRYGTFSNTCLT